MKRSINVYVIFILFSSFYFNAGYGQNKHWEWVKRIYSKTNCTVNAVAIDKAGNSYVTGSFSDTLALLNNSLYSRGFFDIFIAKINPAGEIIWQKQAGGNDADEAYGLSIDPEGNVYITGYVSGNADFSGVQLKSKGVRDFFLAKYDTEGNLKWVKSQEGTNEDYGKSVCVDRDGNVYAAGVFHGTIVMNGKEYKSKGKLNLFIYKYGRNGDFIWGHVGKGEGTDHVAEINVDPSGNLYVAGTFEGNAEFDHKQIVSLGTRDVFLAKYDPKDLYLIIDARIMNERYENHSYFMH